MNKNILIIGTYFDIAVDSYRWWSELPNLSDYDTIILDPTRIIHDWLYSGRVKPLSRNRYVLSDKNEQDDKIESNIRLVRRKLLEMLWFKVDVYALYAPTIIIDYIAQIANYASSVGSRESVNFFRTNDWCPISIETYVEKGKIIHIKDDSFKEYFRDFGGWEYYFVSDSLKLNQLEQYYEKRWKVTGDLEEIAINNVDKPIAVKFRPCFHRWSAKEKRGWDAVPDAYGGRLSLLPIIDPYDTKPLIGSLLYKIGLYTETPPPAWVNSIEILGEKPIKKDIETSNQQLEALIAAIKEKENSLANLQKIKGLLYETGLTLQELVKSTFNEIGVKTKPSIATDEFIIEFSGQEVLIEVKGNVKGITKDDVAQLVADLMEHLKKTGQEIQGLLIGNGWRLEPLEQRDVGNKHIFSKDAIRVAENHNIGLLSTTELFKAYCQILENPIRKADILNGIIGGNGIIKF